MSLYKEILVGVLSKEDANVVFPNLTLNAGELIANESYKALQKIKAIIAGDSLTDSECFMKIEEIVRVFEDMGSTGGGRHDF